MCTSDDLKANDLNLQVCNYKVFLLAYEPGSGQTNHITIFTGVPIIFKNRKINLHLEQCTKHTEQYMNAANN